MALKAGNQPPAEAVLAGSNWRINRYGMVLKQQWGERQMVCYFHKTLPSPTTQPAAELGAGELLPRAHWSAELLGKETDHHLCPETERNSSSADSGAGRLVGVNNQSTSGSQCARYYLSSSLPPPRLHPVARVIFFSDAPY